MTIKEFKEKYIIFKDKCDESINLFIDKKRVFLYDNEMILSFSQNPDKLEIVKDDLLKEFLEELVNLDWKTDADERLEKIEKIIKEYKDSEFQK